MQGKLALTTPAHVFAASPAICKDVVNKLKVQCVETNEYKVVPRADLQWPMLLAYCDTVQDDFSDDLLLANDCLPAFCLPLQELDVLVSNSLNVPAIYDTGSQIIVIRKDIIQLLGIHINTQQLIEMEGANSATNWTVGCAENLLLQVGDVPFKIHAHVIENTSFGILFGCPFQQALLCRFKDLPGGKVELSVCNPSNISHRVYIPTRPRIGRAPAIKIISIVNHMLPPTLPPPAQVTAQHPPLPLPPLPLTDILISLLETNSATSAQRTHPHRDHLHMRFCTTGHISKAQQGKYSCWPAFAHFTCLTDYAATCRSPDNPFPFPHSDSRCMDSASCEFLAHPADPGPAHTCLTCSTTHLLVSPPKHSNLSCQQIVLVSDTDINESTQDVAVRPPCQIKSGILGFRDLRQDYKDGFWQGVIPRREIGHMRHHVTRRITSEDYTSQM